MKKIFLLFTICICLAANLFSADSYVSDVNLYNEINLAFKNRYYPGTVDKVNLLEKQFPDSVFMSSALAYKGDALINMYRYDEAISTLENAISHMHTGSLEMSHCTYLLGKAFYYKKNYSKALEQFHLACNLSFTDGVMYYYHSSILYSARSFYALEKYEEAYPLFEYVISNGNQYTKADFDEALQKIMLSYNYAGKENKTLELFAQLNKEDFSEELYYTLCIYNADACKQLNKNNEAYEYYCQVVENADETLAINALKKAYILASEKNIGVNPGEVFSKTVDTFSENPELVNEFWIRLGIDEYKNKNYKKAEEYFTNVDHENAVVTLYKAKIILDRDKNPETAEELLLPIEKNINNVKTENFQNSYYSVLLQCKFQQKKWNELPQIYSKIKNPSYEDTYAVSASYYEKGDYKNVSPETGVLYASALARSGDYINAEAVFAKTELSASARAEYAKVLFACGKYQDSYNQAQQSNDVNKEYISGLCQINLKNWELAKNHFANYIKQMSGKSDFIKLVFFYKGYSEYCLEEYKNSYASFVRFGAEAVPSQIVYTRKGYEYAAKSALQTGDFKNAAVQAENVIKNSTNLEEKHSAVLFCSEIFSDYENYDKALSILLPYTLDKSDFAVQALFAAAKVYEKQGNVESADNSYKKIYTDFPKSELAEEAMYRCGEVYYSHRDYVTALNCFNKYIYKYANGKFSDGAMFFCGDCSIRLGEVDRAIMLNKTMLQKYPASIYSYGANKNLLEAYYEQESYNQALDVAKIIVKNFPEQAASDEIGRRLIELEKIVSGTDKQVAEKQSEYEKLGKSTTKKGRIAGSELVKLYADSSDTQKDAFELAKELLSKQTANDEKLYAADNAEFIADFYRRNQMNKEAAEMYLTAAEYFRSLDNSSKAAGALYGAAEAFISEGLAGDAEETAKLLIQLYPESKQAERVERLLN